MHGTPRRSRADGEVHFSSKPPLPHQYAWLPVRVPGTLSSLHSEKYGSVLEAKENACTPHNISPLPQLLPMCVLCLSEPKSKRHVYHTRLHDD